MEGYVPTTPQQRARRLIEDCDHVIVATADRDGTPWVSPVFFVSDERYDLYWTSHWAARHSENIRETGRCALVIYEVEPGRPVDAVYMSAQATELVDPEEVRTGIEVLGRRPQPEKWVIDGIDDVIAGGPWRIYRAHPTTVEVRAEGRERGKPVAGRQPADFR